MSINWWINKQNVYPYNGVLSSNKEKWSIETLQHGWTLAILRSEIVSHSVTSDSLWPHGLSPTSLFCPWNSLGKNTGIGSHSLFYGIFLTQESNPGLPHCTQVLYQVMRLWWILVSPMSLTDKSIYLPEGSGILQATERKPWHGACTQ